MITLQLTEGQYFAVLLTLSKEISRCEEIDQPDEGDLRVKEWISSTMIEVELQGEQQRG